MNKDGVKVFNGTEDTFRGIRYSSLDSEVTDMNADEDQEFYRNDIEFFNA